MHHVHLPDAWHFKIKHMALLKYLETKLKAYSHETQSGLHHPHAANCAWILMICKITNPCDTFLWWCCRYTLSQSKEAESKVLEELHALQDDDPLLKSGGRRIQFDDLRKLPYLQAVIKASLNTIQYNTKQNRIEQKKTDQKKKNRMCCSLISYVLKECGKLNCLHSVQLVAVACNNIHGHWNATLFVTSLYVKVKCFFHVQLL